jgi:hypothetical protein
MRKMSKLIELARLVFSTKYCSKEEIESRITSYKIHNALAKRLEIRGMIREAIQLYEQAARIYTSQAYNSLEVAAHLAQKNSMKEKAAEIWLESAYFAILELRLRSFVNSMREYMRSRFQ